MTGLPENVEETIDHILSLEEEYLADVVDSEALQVYLKPQHMKSPRHHPKALWCEMLPGPPTAMRRLLI